MIYNSGLSGNTAIFCYEDLYHIIDTNIFIPFLIPFCAVSHNPLSALALTTKMLQQQSCHGAICTK